MLMVHKLSVSPPLYIIVTVTVTDFTCIAPPTRRPRAHHRFSPYPDAHRQNRTEMFSVHDETV